MQLWQRCGAHAWLAVELRAVGTLLELVRASTWRGLSRVAAACRARVVESAQGGGCWDGDVRRGGRVRVQLVDVAEERSLDWMAATADSWRAAARQGDGEAGASTGFQAR